MLRCQIHWIGQKITVQYLWKANKKSEKCVIIIAVTLMASFIHSAHGREMKCSVAGKCNRLEKNKIIGMKREAHRWSSAPCWRDMGNVIDSRAMHLWFEFVSVELHFSWAEVKLRKFIEIGFFFSGRRIDSLIIENQRKQMREIGHFPLSLFPPAYTHTQTKIKAIAKLDSAPKSIENQLKMTRKMTTTQPRKILERSGEIKMVVIGVGLWFQTQ